MEYFYINFFMCYLKIKINTNKAKLLTIIIQILYITILQALKVQYFLILYHVV